MRLYPRVPSAESFKVDHPRVLHLIGSLERGGTEHQLVELIRRSPAPERHLVAVFTRMGDLAASLPSPPVMLGPIRRGASSAASITRAIVDLHRLVREMQPDVVHAHLAHSEVLASIGVPRGTPIVASRRGRTPLFERPVAGKVALAAALYRERMIVCNTDDLAVGAGAHRLAPSIVVIPNGVDCRRFCPSPLPEGPPTVVMVARLRPQKAHDRFLRAFRGVRDQLPTARAVLVGDGPLLSDLERLASDLELGDSVRFVGGVSDTRPYLAESHVAVLTSPYEGLPNALLEAMAAGRPVVATAVGGVVELVRDGREGLLAPVNDEALTAALIEVLSNRHLAARMGAAARVRAESFDWKITVARTEAMYRSVVGVPAIGEVRVAAS